MLVVLSGYTAVGKDTYQDWLFERNPKIKRALSATTRPIRPGETDGKEYIFLDGANYMHLLFEDKILEERVYHTIKDGKDAVWRYGLLKQDFDDGDWIAVIDHQGTREVLDAIGHENVRVVYLTAPEQELYRRSQARQDEAAEFHRRLEDDKIKFKGMKEITDMEIGSYGTMDIHEVNLKKIEELFRRN